MTLLVGTSYIWYVVNWEERGNILTIDFLNIGQGDATYIQAPNGNSVLIDGSPGRILLSELGKVTPFYKRSVNAIVVTNPDADHYAGFIDLLGRYKVGELIEPGTFSPTGTYKIFEDLVAEKHVPKIIGRRGMKIILDSRKGIYLEILFPDQDVSTWTTNNGSIVAKLVYGKTAVMFEGDAPQATEKYLLALDRLSGHASSTNLGADILKVGHHGSRTATAPEYVAALRPTYGIVSAGLNNTYGFPHKETVDTLNNYNVKMLVTFKLGTIEMKSDGQHVWQK